MSGAVTDRCWQQTARGLLGELRITEWEREFLGSILRRRSITDRQAVTLQRIATEPGAEEITTKLGERIESLSVELVGEEPTYRGALSWRFYAKGGLAVTVSGEKRGIWHDFTADKGGDALDLVAHVRDCNLADALKWARGWLGHAVAEAPRQARPRTTPPPPDTLPFAHRIWRESVPARGPVVETYLVSRGLALPSDAPLRFHPHCPRGTERLPAMISLMTDPRTDEPCGVHRTFLRSDGNGKADGEPKKAMLGHAGVIRLVPDEEVMLGLGLAEGVETALAIMQHADWKPVWAASSASGIARFPVLDGIECVTIFADHDDKGAGLKAAHQCADRWIAAGREARIELPPGGADWLDALAPAREAA